jgi:hypothetical protein
MTLKPGADEKVVSQPATPKPGCAAESGALEDMLPGSTVLGKEQARIYR